MPAVEPVTSAYLGLTGNIPQVSPDTVRDLARAASADGIEALFLSCTNLPTADVLAELEAELGVPVLSANLVSVWSALRSLDALDAGRPEQLFRRTAT
jgi:maleate isomerase